MHRGIRFAVCYAMLCLLACVRMPAAAAVQSSVAIDTRTPGTTYSRLIFGGFLEHFGTQIYGGLFDPGSPLADTRGFRTDAMAALKELRVPIVRWPGGCYASGYRWEAGVGHNRQPTDDMAWGVVEPNTFGTDEFVELCRQLDWLPYICTNAGNGTVKEMRSWVEYCNAHDGAAAAKRIINRHSKPFNVGIWSIGNENWGRHEIGYKPIEQWSPLVLEAARAMKAADPSIQLTAAALPSRGWMLPLLAQAGDQLDAISIHSYALPLHSRNDAPDYLTCIMESEGPEKLITGTVGILEESGRRGRIKIAYDEWNLRSWHHPGFPRQAVADYASNEVKGLVAAREANEIASQYTMADALFAASFFNSCLRHSADVGIANVAPLVNTRGPLHVHAKGVVRRTHFHTMAMYANELESRVAGLTLTSPQLVHGDRQVATIDAVATVNSSGDRWSIALVNRHPEESTSCRIAVNGRSLPDGEYDAIVLQGDSPEAFNDIDHPDRVAPERRRVACANGTITLPPHSLTIFKSLPPAPAKPPRWNILFVFADDWGRYAGCYAGLDGRPSPNDVVQTPHIDRLGREGVVFRNAFVNAPSCTPCRSSLLSGRAFFNCGRGAILHGAIWDETIPVFPLLLRDSGYAIGKSFKVWGPGIPADAPFGRQRYAYEEAGGEAMHFSTSATKMLDRGLTVDQARTTILAQVRGNFDAFLENQEPDTPWLYFAGTTTTHRKWVKGSGRRLWGIDPDALEGKLPPFLPDVPEIREDVADYLGEVQAVDASIGEILERLTETGQLERTLIVVSGDHGMPGVPAGKNNLYDHGVRVALVARVPGGTPGRIVDDYVSLPDLAPTFLDIGGIPLPGGLYGRSLLPQLLATNGGQIDPTRMEVITGRERHVAAARAGHLPYPSRALRTRDFLYIRNFAPDRWPLGAPDGAIGDDAPRDRSVAEQTYAAFADVDAGPTKSWVIAHRDDPQWRWLYDYAFGKRPAEELYHLRTDPDQINNVAGTPEYAATQAEMSRRLMAELERLGDPRISPDVLFEKSPFTAPREQRAK